MNQKIDGMAAGGDDDISVLFAKNSIVFIFHDGCADCRFFNVVKSELFERAAHGLNSHALIVGDKGGSEADYNRVAALEKDTSLFGSVHDLLGVLRANNKAMAAENTLVADDMSLVTRESDGLDGTVANTFIAVFAV